MISAIQDLVRYGIRAVPAVIVGERACHGWNLAELAQFMGVEYVAPGRLSPDELAKRQDRILEAAQRAIQQVPPQYLRMMAPDRARSLRDLGYHIFRSHRPLRAECTEEDYKGLLIPTEVWS